MVNLRSRLGSDDEFAERDIDSDDEEEVEPEEEYTGKEYVPQKRLQQHTWKLRRIEELVKMMEGPDLILDPAYQRNVVWQKDRMTRLINSLLSNFYIPPLIFNVKSIDDGKGGKKLQRICIDGKQRLSSIREFVAGNIPCYDIKKSRWFFRHNGEHRGKRILSENWKNDFTSLELLVVEYKDLELEQEEDLFARVQMGVELRPAEKLKAKSGPWQTFASEIENNFPDLVALIDNNRSRAFQTILSTFKILLSDDDTPSYSTGASTLTPFLDRVQLLTDEFKKEATYVFNTFNEVHKARSQIFKNNNYRHSTNFAPIEFVGVCLLIHRHQDRSVGLLAGDIKRMREFLREQRQELRSNSSTFKVVAEYINDLPIHRGGQGVTALPEDDEMDVDMQDVQEMKPKVVNGTAVPVSTPSSAARGKGKSTTAAAQATPSSSRLPPMKQAPTPAAAASSGASSKSKAPPPQKQQQPPPSIQKPTVPVLSAQKPFNPPTGPAAQRGQQKVQKMEPYDSMAPVAPMTRMDPSTQDQFKLRPTAFTAAPSSVTSTSYSTSTSNSTSTTRPVPNTSSFRVVNTSTPKRPTTTSSSNNFLPDLGSPPITPSASGTSTSLATRKRQRREEEELDDDDDEFNLEVINRGTTSLKKRTQIDDDVDLIETAFRRLPEGKPLGVGPNGVAYGTTGGRNTFQRQQQQGGWAARQRGGTFGATRRVKQEPAQGGGGQGKYGPFTVDDG